KMRGLPTKIPYCMRYWNPAGSKPCATGHSPLHGVRFYAGGCASLPAYLRSFAGVSNRSGTMVALTVPDGARREDPDSITGLAIAKGISPSLAKRTVAMALDGVVSDLGDPIERDANIEFLTREDPRSLELIRHDCAHVLAEAVQTLWPGTQVTIGTVIEDGFYFDLFSHKT